MTVSHADPSEGSTLALPRILCLHGGGTNARIFRIQCRVLERALRSHFRLVYAEAPFPSKPGPDVISVYQKYGPFKAWLRASSDDPKTSAQDTVDHIDAALSATMYADNIRGATGKWVGILGFSQGAKLAASILYSLQSQRQRSSPNFDIWPDFRFSLLLAGRGPLVWLAPELPTPPGLVDAAQLSTSTYEPMIPYYSDQHILRTPTIHVHGLSDPGLPLHRKLLDRYCDPFSSSLLEWDGGHRVPIKTKDVNAIVEQVFSIAQETGVWHPWT